MSPRFDLRREVAWIPVTYLDGTATDVTLQTVFEHAHLIDEITAHPATWAALMRFLPGVTALIAREDPAGDYERWGADGIPQAAIDQALNAIDAHLWLLHPDTPFLQEPLLDTTSAGNDPEWLQLTHPGASSKAWWGKPGDHRHPDAGTPARVAQGLLCSWFFSPGVGGQAAGTYTDRPDEAWRPRGTLTFTNHGLRVYWRGRTLAHTLLANTMDAHVTTSRRGRGANLPLWAAAPGAAPSDGPLTASTWTGSVYKLAHDGHRFIAVHIGGRRIPGATGDKAARAAAAKALERDLWRADPTIARVPVRKAGQDTGQVRSVKALHPSASAVQWAADWYATDSTRGTAHAMEPGLVDADNVDVFAIRLDGRATAPEITAIRRVGEASTVLTPAARTRLHSLSAQILTPIQSTLYAGLVKAFGRDGARGLQDRLFATFCTRAETTLDDIIHADTLTREHARQFAQHAVDAFEQFLTPYLTPSALAAGERGNGIAAALAYVEHRARSSTREVAS